MFQGKNYIILIIFGKNILDMREIESMASEDKG